MTTNTIHVDAPPPLLPPPGGSRFHHPEAAIPSRSSDRICSQAWPKLAVVGTEGDLVAEVEHLIDQVLRVAVELVELRPAPDERGRHHPWSA